MDTSKLFARGVAIQRCASAGWKHDRTARGSLNSPPSGRYDSTDDSFFTLSTCCGDTNRILSLNPHRMAATTLTVLPGMKRCVVSMMEHALHQIAGGEDTPCNETMGRT